MRLRLLLLPLLGAVFATASFTATFNQLVVFGDSLSDTGNVSIATNGLFPGANYAPGRFTDGPNTTPASNAPAGLWVDQLAAKLGVSDPQPVLAGGGGSNYAFASATTGSNGLYNISDQVGLYGLTQPGGASASALFTLWGGANDLFNNANAPTTAAANLAGDIQTLAAAGAKNFLWINLPPLGSTPRAVASGDMAALTAATLAFNQAWATDIAMLRGMGINVVGLDVYSLFGAIAGNPGAYGFTNINTPAQGLANVNPNNYLFWDVQHPTTAGHALVADLAYNALNAPEAVPEPATALATLAGLGVIACVMRARRVQSGGGRRRPTG